MVVSRNACGLAQGMGLPGGRRPFILRWRSLIGNRQRYAPTADRMKLGSGLSELLQTQEIFDVSAQKVGLRGRCRKRPIILDVKYVVEWIVANKISSGMTSLVWVE